MTYTYYPGQLDYLSRMATKSFGLVAADTGTGKTLMAISLIRLKLEEQRAQSVEPGARGADAGPNALPLPLGSAPDPFRGRALVVAPQATAKGVLDVDDADDFSQNLPQWRAELNRFAPEVPVFELFSWADYQRLTCQGQYPLPDGIYLSYYEALFRNGSLEVLPESWDHWKLCATFQQAPGALKTVVKVVRLNDDDTPSGETILAEPTVILGQIQEGAIVRLSDHLGKRFLVREITERPVVDYTQGIGDLSQRGGIRCVAAPCLATRIESAERLRHSRDEGGKLKPETPPTSALSPQPSAFPWDMVCLDEAHVCCNLGAQVTQSLLRLQAPLRFAFTATPIPNIVTNLFSLMGWLAVPEWYQGKRRSAAWPYAVDEAGQFNQTFLSEERDYTQEDMNEAANPKWRGTCVKISPVIASPARLLKLLAPTMAFLSKEMCFEPRGEGGNLKPEAPRCTEAEPRTLQPCRVVDVRVGMGRYQAELYAHFMDRKHIDCKNALVRARKQLAYLRGITADPAGFEHGGPRCATNYNPKTVAILELVRDILERGEPVVVITARIGQTQTLYDRLAEAIRCAGLDPAVWLARIDSTITPAQQAAESARFKSGRARVMFMGIKCAKAFSYDQCPNEIIGSLEYSFGSLHQAKGRVWRVNSAQPVTVYCVLHQATIEETMFDIVATKQDAATICLHGQRVPRDYKPVDLTEVLAESRLVTAGDDLRRAPSEHDLYRHWPALRLALATVARNYQGRYPHPAEPPKPAQEARRPLWQRRLLALGHAV